MKKLSILAAIAAAAACLWACKADNDPKKPDDGKTVTEIMVSPASVTFEADGGTLRVALSAEVDYTVEGTPSWLTIQQNGQEIALTAAANTVPETRNAVLTIKASSASCTLEVSQKPGSPYPGYTVVSEAKFEYAGTMLYMFGKPSEEDYGGQGYLYLNDEDGNSLGAWIYTDLFTAPEEVELSVGTYTKGADLYPLGLCAKKLTYMPGSVYSMTDEDEEESFVAGTYYFSVAEKADIPLVDGTIEVSAEGGVYTIKATMKDESGKEYKIVYIGKVDIDTEYATYPSENERIDVAANILEVLCEYKGDAYETDTNVYTLMIYSGEDMENSALTCFEFITDPEEFSEDMDLSGEYVFPGDPEEDPEALTLYSAGTLVPGSLVELVPGFSMPMGTYVMYSPGDYLVGDAYASLSLEKQSDGTYNMSASIMEEEPSDMVMFLNKTGLDITLLDATQNTEDY